MGYRLTNTEKWSDSWFTELKPLEKLLFIYLCDNCDIAGFIEYLPKRWAADLGLSIDQIKGALKGLGRGLVASNDNSCFYLRNFLKHQKNYPLNEKNNIYSAVIKRFENYSQKFDIQDINSFIEGACKGLVRGSQGGNVNNNCLDIEKGYKDTVSNNNLIIPFDEEIKVKKTWRDDFNIYVYECKSAFALAWEDEEFIKKQEYIHNNLDIRKTLINAEQYWSTPDAWEHKKSDKKVKNINWRLTIISSINNKFNGVPKSKQ